MCFEPTNADCAILPYCVLRKALDRARTAFVEALDDYALSDLVKPRGSLQAMLSIAPVKATRASAARPKRERPAKQ
jgi:Rrf2 family transcriptional regulator, nitric oxide-sensitive transcriptional repressor